MKKTIKISGLLSALLLVCGGAHAAGLGKLSVQSALGQPLRAEIELLSVSKDELSGISAQLANRELFRQARIDPAGALSGLEFSVAQRSNGQPVVRITSAVPMAEPFLDMLIELNWSTGRIIREYTILLDPPAEARASAPAPVKAAAPVSTPPRDVAGEAPRPLTEAAKPADKPVDKAPAAAPAPSRYGPVRSGETLRSIAGRLKGAEVTLEQMMAGLYLTNKRAFIDNNMNLLKQGAVLSVPSSETVHLQNSPAQALRMVQSHLEEWHAYRGKVAEVAGEAPESRAEAKAAGGKITPKVEDKSVPASAPKDVLKLSKGEPGGGAKQDAKTQERLQMLEEELAAKARALQESQDRVTQLERTVRDMQQLLEMKSQEAAKAAAPAPATQPAPAAPAAVPAPHAAARPVPVPVPPSAAPAEEGSWLTTFLKNPLYIGGVVAALLLSGLLWMMMAGNRRRKGLNKFEDSIMTGGEFKSGAVFNTGGAEVVAGGGANTEGSMLLTDFSRLGLGAIDTHEVDPIAEAEVYMAYGRDAQAEEILKEALDKDSSRHEIALKLLEIYAARKDPLAFETTASELYAGLGGQDTPVWQRAAEMGRSIDPENPLYRMTQGQSFAAATAPAPAREPEVTAEPEPVAAQEDISLDFIPNIAPEPKAEAAEDVVALDFGAPYEAPVATPEESVEVAIEPLPEAKEEESISLDFESVSQEAEPIVVEAPAPVAAPVASEVSFEAHEFEAVPETIEIAAPQPEAAEQVPELDLSGIDLDLAPEAPAETEAEAKDEVAFEMPEAPPDLDFQPAPVEEVVAAPAATPTGGIDPTLWEEANTKLELARAYLEMGDREGAREILQEVLQEGDEGQQAEARRLLVEVG